MTSRIFALITMVFAFVGCTNPEAPPAPTGSALTLGVPTDATGVPRQLVVILTDEWPVTRPPTYVLLQDTDPAIVPGADLELSLDTEGIVGTFYLVSVLYMEGGGTWTPEPGIDFQAHSAGMVEFGGGDIALGRLDLQMTE